MSKKIMKRSLVLSALMTFVITGNALAAVYDVSTDTNICEETFADYSLTASDDWIIKHQDKKLTIENCTFTNNSKNVGGNASVILSDGGVGTEDVLVINNCKFTKNTGNTNGIIYIDATNVEITDCEFTDNESGLGGAIYNHITPELKFCGTTTFKGNIDKDGRYNDIYNDSFIVIESGAVVNLYDHEDATGIVGPGCIEIRGTLNGRMTDNGNSDKELQEVTLTGGTWNIKGKSNIFSLASNDGIIGVNDLSENTCVRIPGDGKIHDIASLTIKGSQEIADSLTTENYVEKLNELADVVYKVGEIRVSDTPYSVATDVYTPEGTVMGELTAKVVNGDVEESTIVEKVNSTNESITNMVSTSVMTWRAGKNDMNKRIGELRNANGEHGVWVRIVNGENEYKNVETDYQTYQLGYDEKLIVDPSWTIGAAVSYTEADTGTDKVSGENRHKALSIYGCKLNDDGSFIDLIAKVARIEHDFNILGKKGDWGSNGYSLSAEYGKRFDQGNGLWIEPQVEVTYGKISSTEYKIAGRIISLEDMDSLVGRVGFSLGKNIKQGNAYVRASYLYEFECEPTVKFSNNTATRSFKQDLGGGWWEVGVGANINLSKATYIYADVEKTFGGEVDTNWQWNLGVRYSF